MSDQHHNERQIDRTTTVGVTMGVACPHVDSTQARQAAAHMFSRIMISPASGHQPVGVDLVSASAIPSATAVVKAREEVPGGDGVRRGDLAIAALEGILQALESSREGESIEQFEDRLRDDVQKSRAANTKALARVQSEQLTLERAWTEVAQFVKSAAGQDGKLGTSVTVCAAGLDELESDESLWNAMAALLPGTSAMDQNSCFGLLVVPTWPASLATLKRIGELAADRRAIAVVGYKDCPTIEEARQEFGEGGDLQSVRGSDAWHAHVVLAGNHIRTRVDDGGEGLYISPAPVLAGMIAAGDTAKSPAVPQSGYPHPVYVATTDASKPITRWNLDDAAEVASIFHRAVIPLVNLQGRLVFWGMDTLSTDKTYSCYSVMRSKEYIEKCLSQFFFQQTFTHLGSQAKLQELRRELERFLMCQVGNGDQHMLEQAKILNLQPVPGSNGRTLDVQLALAFKVPMDQAVLEITGYEAEQAANGTGTSLRHKSSSSTNT